MLRLDINLVFTIINLLILYFGVRHFLLKPVQNIIAERQKQADEAFEEAKSRQEEAEKARAQYEASLSDIDRERAEVLEKARREADDRYHRILSEAEAAAEKTISSARNAAELDKKKILQSAEAEIQEMVLTASEKMMAQKSSGESDSLLYDAFIEKAGEEN